MNSDKNTNTRESTSNGRRVSSILKRQDSCVASEGTDGSGECPRTPRRVSFATTAAVMRYFPDNVADESCASAGSNSDSSAASPGSSLNADQDSVFAPPPCPPAQMGYEGEMASGMNLTNESPESHPDVLVQAVSMFQQDVTVNSHRGPMKEGGLSPAKQNGTILCTSLNESECSIDLTANVPQIISAVSRQDGENEREYISGKQQEAQNRTVLFSNMDEYGCCMDITSNLSESLFQENNENYHQDISFRKGQPQARPGLNRVPSFADEQTYESEDDRAFIEGDANIAQQNVPDRTIIFSNKNGEEMELTEYLEEPVTCSSHTGKDVYENMIVKPKSKTLDDLFKLVKKQESSFVADCSEEDFTTLDPEDMEITGEQSRVVPRAALSDIITRKALTPIEEVSLISSNVSLADQDSRFQRKPSYTLQPHAAVSKLNLEQMLSVQHSSSTADFVFEKAFISPQNKENYPILCHDYKILAEGQNIPAGANKYAGNISLGIASHGSRRKSNKSLQDVSIKECQTGKVHMEQESNETPRIKAIIPSQLGSRINPDQNRVNYNLQQDEGKTGLDYPYNYVPVIENNCKDDAKLQRRMEEWDGTALFTDVESMKFVTSNTRTADVGQNLGYGKELKDCILSFDSSEVEMTKCLSKTIEIDGNKQKYLRPVDECSDQRTHVCNNSVMEMTKCLSETVEFGKNKQKSLRSESECLDQRTHVCDNSLMEMTKCLSRTIEVDGNKQKSLKSESGYSDERTRVCDNSLMEMTKCLSKTIEVDGNKQKSLKSEFGYSDERTRVCDNSLMEMTKCLSKTIEFGGNKLKSLRSETEYLDQRTLVCDNILMEMTNCLSKTIEFNGNMQKNFRPESECLDQRTHVCNNSLMEMTKCLSKTIEVDGNKQKSLKSESGCSDERTRICDNSLMEMTESESRTIHIGSKPNERAEIFSENPVNANENKVYILNSSHVDLPAFPVNFVHDSSKAVPRDHSETSQILNNFATEIKECTSNVTSCGQIASSEIKESCKVQSAVGPYTVNNDTSCQEVNGCIIERPKRLKLSVNQAKNEIFVSGTDRCSIPIQDTPFQSDFTAAEHNDVQYSNLHQNIGDNFSVLLDAEKLEGQFSIGNRGMEDSLQCNTGTNIKFRKKDIVCDQETLMRDAEKIAESGQQMVSLQEKATRIVDHKHEALRQALSKDLGLSLSLSKKPLNIFDPMQRRKSCNFDLVLGKGNKGQTKIYQFPLVSQMNSNRAASVSSEVSYKRDSPTPDLTDMSAVLEQTKGLPTFIYDHLSNSSLSESLATATSAKPRLKEALSLDKDSILLGPSSTANNSELVSSGGAANFHTSSSSCEDVLTEAVETLSNQEMPKLIEGTPDCKLMERSLEFDEDSILSDLNIISMMDPVPFNMQDLYEALGISRLKKAPVKSMPFQNVPRTTVKENLLAKVLDVPRFSCLKQHVNEVETTVNRSKQECKDKSKEFYHKLPDPLQALLSKESRNNVPDLKMKAVEMVSACRTSAKAMWMQHKADYLMKYSDARESARHALDCETEKVISATEKIDGLIASIDKCLGEVEEIFNRKQELMKQEKDLKEAEMEVKELKLQCKEMDDRVISLEKLNKEAAESIINIETGQEDAKEKLSCMFSLTDWTIMEKTKSWIHFGFLYGTIILQVHLEDSGSSCQKISRITLHSRLGADSRPWAKLTHNMAMSSIDCKSLHVLYRSYDQIHELLTDVSAIASDCRQLSTELKHAHLKHRLTVDGNRLKFVVSNRKTRQQVRLDTSVVENSCLHLPLEWNVTTLLGNVSSHAVKSAIEKIHGRHMYITRVLSEVEQQLARYKQR